MTHQPTAHRPKAGLATPPPATPVLHPLPEFASPVHFLTTTAEIEALAERLARAPRFAELP